MVVTQAMAGVVAVEVLSEVRLNEMERTLAVAESGVGYEGIPENMVQNNWKSVENQNNKSTNQPFPIQSDQSEHKR